MSCNAYDSMEKQQNTYWQATQTPWRKDGNLAYIDTIQHDPHNEMHEESQSQKPAENMFFELTGMRQVLCLIGMTAQISHSLIKC